LVEDNRAAYKKTKKSAYLTKPLHHSDFGAIVHQIACGNTSTTALCVEADSEYTFFVTMGATMALDEEWEEQYGDKNLFTEVDKLKMLSPVNSTPFQVDFVSPFAPPVVKLV